MNSITLQQVLPAVFSDTPPSSSEIWQQEITLQKGEYYLIEAASGTGKSSLLAYLYGYRRDYTGVILFDGSPSDLLSRNSWSKLRRRSLSMMFQDLRLFPELSAADNVRIKNRLTHHLTETRLREMFEELDMADKWDTPVNRLSFGQQQRVAFIRSLSQPFDFLLLDEPVSHLDDQNSDALARLLLDEAKRQEAGLIITSIGRHPDIAYNKIYTL